nr:transposase [Dietzia sp. CQ4]
MVEWVSGRLVVREHLGSAHTPGELAALIEVAKQRIQGDQQALDLELSERGAAVIDVPAATAARIQQSTARILWQGLTGTYSISDMVVVADAGMLSAANLNALEDAGLSFIVGSRTSKAPKELEDHFGRRGNLIADDGVVELIRPMGQGRDRRDRRVVWHYKWERAKRDRRTLNAQIDRAQRVADRAEPLKKQRFVKVTDQKVILDEASIQRARESAGYKGYVTNIAPAAMDGHAVVAAYHDLWKVEQSFRMAKADLRARPIFHRTRDAIEAHLTVVFAALAVARHLQDVTGMSIKKIVTTLRPLRTVTVAIGDHEMLVEPTIPDAARAVIDAINAG